jgi:hypothetical protein
MRHGGKGGYGWVRPALAGVAALLMSAAGFLATRVRTSEETSKETRSNANVSATVVCGHKPGARRESAAYGHPHHTSTCEEQEHAGLPVVDAELTAAPHVPRPVGRSEPVLLRVRMEARVKEGPLDPPLAYDFWTFSDTVPGPFIRARVGDTIAVTAHIKFGNK